VCTGDVAMLMRTEGFVECDVRKIQHAIEGGHISPPVKNGAGQWDFSKADVAAVEPLKRQACMAHQSQNPTDFYLQDHVPMLRFRGMECGCKLAEAFIHHDQSPPGRLPA
jgi:hypothetical protein